VLRNTTAEKSNWIPSPRRLSSVFWGRLKYVCEKMRVCLCVKNKYYNRRFANRD